MDADVLLDVAKLDEERRRLSREHPARPRMKADRRSAVQASANLRREIGGALLGPDQLHAIAKTAGGEAAETRKLALEQAQNLHAPAAGTGKTTSCRRWEIAPAIGPR